MTDKPASSKGNFRGFLNRTKVPGDNRPLFQGKLSLPGKSDERAFALWSYTSERTGQSVLSGKAGLSAADQIANLTNPNRQHDTDTTIALATKAGAEALEIQPGDIVMFTNPGKQENPERPDYFGYFNPGGRQPLMRISGWTDTDRAGNAMISGSLILHEPRRGVEPERSDDGDEREDDEHERAA